MYVADWEQYRQAFATTNAVPLYTKAEETHAKQAYELLRTSGFPSVGKAIHLLQDGNITGLPALTAEDLRRVYELYGTPPAYVRGKMTKKKGQQGHHRRRFNNDREEAGVILGRHAH